MLTFWNALEEKFRLYYEDDQTTRCVLLIAKMLFWWIYSAHISKSDIRVHESFAAFFGLGEGDG